ncbi:histidine triad (HIT) nucleotide-binding protein [Gracilibacillus boraciitolerans JCM 21714]|uniref:Histidine triad (HIT) nucleotide-binding protein n=1 Tax=Gracilibacillus boraciitolerans JCM 21714 TaxID=1298598 RepID=W4VKD9_9BACI|nr:HIT family protein [Gracilibacillus boraciitolerans]GAE93677.1 histidine triad (HIT) nucleotide-binding protein [Gracilibacillus boraciitolerans JCM 21714]
MTTNSDCIFCKIKNGEIPSAIVYEDDDVYAFLDLSQVTKGHTLVIPKQHTKNIYETDETIASKLFARVPKIANAIKETFQPIGINILSNNEEAAGQSVFHLHLHLIPRYDQEDGFRAKWETHEDQYDLAEVASAIKNNI